MNLLRKYAKETAIIGNEFRHQIVLDYCEKDNQEKNLQIFFLKREAHNIFDQKKNVLNIQRGKLGSLNIRYLG